MNIYNLRDRNVPVGIIDKQLESHNEIIINMPSAGRIVETDPVRAQSLLWQDMQYIEKHDLNMSIASQVVIDENGWDLAVWMVVYLQQFGIVPEIVLQNRVWRFRLQEAQP